VDTNPRRRVGARLVLQAFRPLEMVLQVAVSGMTGTRVEEDLAVTCDGEPVKAPEVAALLGHGHPARQAAVYAPGLRPMDFHAVAEALVGGAWRVVDATLLAPGPAWSASPPGGTRPTRRSSPRTAARRNLSTSKSRR
jgi:hypothetical protein